MIAAGRYDRILITLSMVALAAMALSGQARAQSADAGPAQLDRYGGEERSVAPAARMRARLAYESRALSWAGKSEAAAPTSPPMQLAYALPPAAPMPVPAYAPPPRDGSNAAALALRRSLGRAAPAPTPGATAEVETLAAAPPAAPAQAVASARPPAAYSGSSVRHYSVHREFGIAPDPTPIPPQFFTATADLSAQSAAEAEPLARTPATQTAAGRTGRARTAATTSADPS